MIIMQEFGSPLGPTLGTGEYLREFDFEAFGGQGEIVMTNDPALAMQFDTMQDALAFRNRSPECKPLREDGRPNRPLTATNWSFEPAPVDAK